MNKELGTAHSAVEHDNVTTDKMTIMDWLRIIGVIAFLATFLGQGILF